MRILTLALVVLLSPALFSQDDPAEIMAAAAKANGLAGPGLQPWHIKLKYQIFGHDGSPQSSGTYEEFRISDKKYKREYAGGRLTQTDIAGDRGLFRMGDQKWPGALESKVRTLATEPIPEASELGEFQLEKTTRSLGKVELSCVVLKPKQKSNVTVLVMGHAIVGPHYCFSPDQPMLRFASRGAGHDDTVYNDLVRFQGRFIARDIRVTESGKPRLTLTIETIENLAPPVSDADFTPPSGAAGPLGQSGAVTIDAAYMQSLLITRGLVHYPAAAKRAHIQGKVVLQVTIGKDGRVVKAQAISGPAELQQGAVDDVEKWIFRPVLILGEPVMVESQFEVMFTLAG